MERRAVMPSLPIPILLTLFAAGLLVAWRRARPS
jgi:hypothetical protein